MKNEQGAIANKNGKKLESDLTELFEENNFPVIKYSIYKKTPEKFKGINDYILNNVPYTTIYGHRGYTEFVLVTGDRRARIEVKSQNSAGSVDEKIPYVLENMIEAYPEKEAILITEGKGFKSGHRSYLKQKIEGNFLDYKGKGKTLYAFNLAEFIPFFLNNFVKDFNQVAVES